MKLAIGITEDTLNGCVAKAHTADLFGLVCQCCSHMSIGSGKQLDPSHISNLLSARWMKEWNHNLPPHESIVNDFLSLKKLTVAVSFLGWE